MWWARYPVPGLILLAVTPSHDLYCLSRDPRDSGVYDYLLLIKASSFYLSIIEICWVLVPGFVTTMSLINDLIEEVGKHLPTKRYTTISLYM